MEEIPKTTTWDGHNPINNGIIIILGDAGFCPSTVCIYLYVHCNSSFVYVHPIYLQNKTFKMQSLADILPNAPSSAWLTAQVLSHTLGFHGNLSHTIAPPQHFSQQKIVVLVKVTIILSVHASIASIAMSF